MPRRDAPQRAPLSWGGVSRVAPLAGNFDSSFLTTYTNTSCTLSRAGRGRGYTFIHVVPEAAPPVVLNNTALALLSHCGSSSSDSTSSMRTPPAQAAPLAASPSAALTVGCGA